MDPTQNINIKHGKNSKSIMTSQVKISANIGFEKISKDNAKMSKTTGIAQEKKIIFLTRRLVMKVKYFKGFTTAM